MKTSFYFLLWIIISAIFLMYGNSFIRNNFFIVALAIVCGLSWLLNRLMYDTLTYERALQVAPILEDVYIYNVEAFEKRISRDAKIATAVAIYFCVTAVVAAVAIFITGENVWIALLVFLFFTYGAITNSVRLHKAWRGIKTIPTSEECLNIAKDICKLDHTSVCDANQRAKCGYMLPPRPRFFRGVQISSIIIAGITALLGLIIIYVDIDFVFSHYSYYNGEITYNDVVRPKTRACMLFLYGSLATYFGIKDFAMTIRSLIQLSHAKVEA